jgi:adenylate cyclase
MAVARPAVVVVEDESIVAHSIQRTLAALGYDAFAVGSSAEEVLASAGQKRPQIALVDLGIKGGRNGLRIAQLLQERFALPVVYLTAHAEDAPLNGTLQPFPFDCLVKPVKPAQLRSAIESTLSRHESHQRALGTALATTAEAPARPAREPRAPAARTVRHELERVFASRDFDAPPRSREFLRFVVEETLAGRGDAITQSAIATRVFGRKDDFDAIVDPIVRIQAGRLRRSLERYYLLAGQRAPVRIELPKGSYVPVFRSVAQADEPAQQALTVVSADDWPSLLLNEFKVVGVPTELGELAADMTEELALELGLYRAVRVLRPSGPDGPEPARPSQPRFALDGRLRQEGEGLRITARLLDRATGEQVWGDVYNTAPRRQRWSGSPDDVARVIAARVGAEEGVVVQLLAAERRRVGYGAPTPYTAFLRSFEFFFARNPESLAASLEALRRVVDAEPERGVLWTRLARLYLSNYTFDVTPIPTPVEEALSCAQQGVRADPASRQARCILAAALLVKGELAAGRDELYETLRSSPGSLAYLEIIGFLLTLLGEWEQGPALCRSALERNPHCLPHLQFGLWADHLRRGALEPAYQAALEYRDPTFFWRPAMRASCLGLLGRLPEARAEVAELLSRKPDFRERGRGLIGHYIKFPEVLHPIVEGLALAGLELAPPAAPEKAAVSG